MHWEDIDVKIFSYYGVPTIQRLGYILEFVLGEELQAEALRRKFEETGREMRRVPLKAKRDCSDCRINSRWNVMENLQSRI